MPIRRSLTLLALTAALAGCAEVSFKRGGSAADFDADKTACQREIGGSGESLADCMDRRGWYLHQFAEGATDEGTADETMTETAENKAGANAGAAATATATTDQATAAKPKASTKKAKASAQPAVIGTWFKFGAGPAALEADQAACVAELGEAHRIVSTTQPVSAAMRACMKKRGWFGLESSGNR